MKIKDMIQDHNDDSSPAANLVSIKQSFAEGYTGTAHIQEAVPNKTSREFPYRDDLLASLHGFAQKNPIYYNHYNQRILGIDCTIYEGDINEYWLNSIKHGSSCQPFYPTWMMSALIISHVAKNLGYTELVDIGSGDGRIAFCGSILGLTAYSIEIDDTLSALQTIITRQTRQNFNPINADALEFDYTRLKLKRPIFFVGGLPQMGGDVLADNIIEKIKDIQGLRDDAAITFAGTHTKRHLSSSNSEHGGWSTMIKRHDLQVIDTISLPTVWTFDQKVETPYIYTRFTQR